MDMRYLSTFVLLIGMLHAAIATAQIAEWQGTVTENWFNALNWNPATIPGSGTNVVLNTWSPNATTLAGAETPGLGAIQIGESGFASLAIEFGGVLNNNAIAVLASAPGSQGFVTVQDAGSEWNVNHNLVVGEQGFGWLQLLDQGYVLNNHGRIANASGSTGTVTLRYGSNWVNAGNLFVAHSGNGLLDIRNESAVFNQAPAFVGYAGFSSGSVRVRDGGGWASYDDMFIGRQGHGKLDIESGGTVLVLNDSSSFIGTQSGGQGEVTVTGTGSGWLSTESLIIGASGSGLLSVTDGGIVIGKIVSVGDLVGSNGTVVIGEDSKLNSDSDLIVGRFGTGSLTIAGGEVINQGRGMVGHEPGGLGEVHLTAPGALWHSHGNITVGHTSAGTLTIAPGAEVVSGGSVRVATVPGGSARLNLRGTLRASLSGGGTILLEGGMLRGTGMIHGGLNVNDWGFVAPGNNRGEIGELSVSDGLYLHSTTAVLEIDLGTPLVSDQIIVTGDLLLNGVLHASADEILMPGIYTLITYTGALTDNGLSIGFLPALPAGHGGWIDTTTQPGEVRLVIGELGDSIFTDRFEG
jgi:T5SS/PEP-CTERM-associated repeat protein